ncbi:MAG TPA: DUF3097 family protein [Dermatophilaceae bacterium]|nr:DUF3097 family protein [Dermatophilaceae bacterium]
MTDRYGPDALATERRAAAARRSTTAAVPAESGLVVEDVDTGWCGAVVRVEKAGGVRVVHLEDRHDRLRAFPLGPGFLLDGRPVVLTPPAVAPAARLAEARAAATRTASGSRAVADRRARVARGSRIFVEGRHDAELVEKVWGEDLRVEGVVVELLEGVDDLEDAVRAFAPGPGRRMGVLVDHLVPGTKEWAVVERTRAMKGCAASLLVVGHPYVDVWQGVRPERVGLERWPEIPRGTSWKVGIAAALGLPHHTQADLASAWRRILHSVRGYADLEPALLGRVEELIDFVTADTGAG